MRTLDDGQPRAAISFDHQWIAAAVDGNVPPDKPRVPAFNEALMADHRSPDAFTTGPDSDVGQRPVIR